MNLAFRHAMILTEDKDQTIIEDGALAIEGQTIAYIGIDAILPAQYASFEMLDCTDCLILPSMINCHTHTAMVAFSSLGDDIANRLRRFLIPLEKSCMTKSLASASLAIAEMQLSGIGCAVNMYYYERKIAQTASEMGFRLFGGETIMEESLRESGKDNPSYQRVYAPHAPYSGEQFHFKDNP